MTEYEAIYIGETDDFNGETPGLGYRGRYVIHDLLDGPHQAAGLARKQAEDLIKDGQILPGDHLIATRKVEDHSDLQFWRIVTELKPRTTLLAEYEGKTTK